MLPAWFCILVAAQSPQPVADALQALEAVDGNLCVVVARQELGVSSPVSGILSSVDVELGERVRRGQTLFRLDEETSRHEAAMASAMVRSAEAEVARARVAHAQAQARYERRHDATGVYSAEEVGTALGQAEIASADLQSAQARLSEQQARLALLEANLRRARVPAPFDGIVAARFQQPGGTLQPGTAVVRLIADSAPLVRFAVPPAEAERYAPGTDVEVVLAGRAAPLRARVLTLAPAVDPAIDLLPAEAEFLPQAEVQDVRVGTVGRVHPTPPASTEAVARRR